MMKKRLLVVIIALAVLLATVFTACNNKKTEEGGDETEKRPTETQDCEHLWERTGIVSGTCKSYGHVDYKCSVCGETKSEYDNQYAAHSYGNHVCIYCGNRQAGEEQWKSGGTTVYLYNLTSTISGDKTYVLLVDGRGTSTDYGPGANRPWSKFLKDIVRFEVTGDVTSVGSGFLYGAQKLTNVTITAPVTSIGDNAFYGCTALESVDFGTKIEKVGVGAFADCSSLRRVNLPKTATSFGASAFEGCNALRIMSLGMPHTEGVGDKADIFGSIFGEGTGAQRYSVGGEDYSFKVPSSLVEITVSADEDIEPYTFCGCSSVVRMIIGGDTKNIGQYAFAKMTGLISLTFGQETLEKIGEQAFYKCEKLGTDTEDQETGEVEAHPVILPATLQELGAGAFDSCHGMKFMDIRSETLEEIPVSAFAFCSALKKINMPDSVTRIQSEAFRNTGLEEIKIAKNVVSVGKDAFADCTRLRTVYVDSADVYAGSADGESRLFDKVTAAWVKKDVVGTVADAKAPGSSYIKQKLSYKNFNPETGYYLWEK